MSAIVFVGIATRLFPQHLLEASATGPMLEAKTSLPYSPYPAAVVSAMGGLFSQHFLEASATGRMLEAKTSPPYTPYLAAVLSAMSGLFAQHILDAADTGMMLEALQFFHQFSVCAKG